MTLIAFAGEDENHFRVATALVDDALVANVDWVRDVLDSCRARRGLHGEERWYKYAPEDAYDLRPLTIGGVTIKPAPAAGAAAAPAADAAPPHRHRQPKPHRHRQPKPHRHRQPKPHRQPKR